MRNMRCPKVKSGLKRGQRSAVRDAWQNRFINNNRRVKGRNGLTVLGKTWLIDGKITSFTLMYDVSEVIGGNNIRYIDM